MRRSEQLKECELVLEIMDKHNLTSSSSNQLRVLIAIVKRLTGALENIQDEQYRSYQEIRQIARKALEEE